MTGLLRLIVVAAVFLGVQVMNIQTAAACTCAPPPTDVRGSEQTNAWKLQRAANVARGRIVSIQAGDDIVGQHNFRVVLATLRIANSVKGAVPTGDVTVVTGLGLGDCGLAQLLWWSFASRQDLMLELHDAPGVFATKPGEFEVFLCGYFAPAPLANSTSPKR